MEKHLTKQGAYLLLMQALIEMTDDPAVSSNIKSRTAANFARRLQEALINKTEAIMNYKHSNGAADQMFYGSQVLIEFAAYIQLIPESRMIEADQELREFFKKYTS